MTQQQPSNHIPEAKKMVPGDELHLTLLMAPFSLHLVTGQDRQHLLAFGRAAFEAGQAAAQQAVQAAVPLFWVRLLRDGLYEGPVHNNSVGGKMLRDENPGEWHPLYLHATHTTQQWMDAQTIKHISALSELVRLQNAEHFADAHNAAVRHLRALAAQAKQGGAA